MATLATFVQDWQFFGDFWRKPGDFQKFYIGNAGCQIKCQF